MRRRLDPLDRRIVGLAVPALGTLAIEPLYNLTDTAIIGHLGRVPLGGLAIATGVLNMLGWSANFLSTATTSAIAHRVGRRDEAGVASTAAAAYWSAVVTGGVLALAVGLAARPLALLLGGQGAANADVVAAGTTYLRIAAVGMPFLLLTYAGNGHLRGLANTSTPLRITVVANAVNVALEVGLVYGARLGVAGSALGTVVAQALSAGLFLGIAARSRGGLRQRPRRADVAELWRAGAVLIIRTAALVAALTASTAVAAHLGAALLGGHQIALQVWTFLALALDALAVPAQVFVGTALGAGDPATAWDVGARCLRMGWWVGAVLGAATAATAPLVPYVFSGDAGVRQQALEALVLCGVVQPLAAVAFVLDGLLLGARAYADLRRAMLLALAAFAPLAVLTVALHLGITGVWGAIGCWLGARALLLGRIWRSPRWRRSIGSPVAPSARGRVIA